MNIVLQGTWKSLTIEFCCSLNLENSESSCLNVVILRFITPLFPISFLRLFSNHFFSFNSIFCLDSENLESPFFVVRFLLTIATKSFILDIAGVLDLLLQVLCFEVFGNKPQSQTSLPITPVSSDNLKLILKNI